MPDVTDFGSDTAEFTLPPRTPAGIRGDLAVVGGLKAVQRIVEQIAEAVAEVGCSSREMFHVRLAIEEALANAVKHGNKHDPDKAVYVTYDVDEQRMIVTVRDEGSGFDRRSLPDPTAEENLTRPGGRGVLLINSFVDSVKYNEIGNSVTLTKKWSSHDS
jgi:serine/threonine-protein kinase RsbW